MYSYINSEAAQHSLFSENINIYKLGLMKCNTVLYVNVVVKTTPSPNCVNVLIETSAAVLSHSLRYYLFVLVKKS